MRYASPIACVLVVSCCCALARADSESTAIVPVSDAIPWATPLHGGPLHVLFIMPRFVSRDAHELALRLEMRFEVATVWTATELAPDPALYPDAAKSSRAEALEKRLLELLATRWDVIVATGFSLDILPVSVQQRVVDSVAKGAGLLLSQYDLGEESTLPSGELESTPTQELMRLLTPVESPPSPTRGIGPLPTADWADPNEYAHFYQYEKGRVLMFEYPGMRPLTHGLLPAPERPAQTTPLHIENAYALVVRAMLWLAGRTPEAAIESVLDISPKGPDENQIPPDLPEQYVQSMKDSVMRQPLRPCLVRLGTPAGRDYGVKVALARPDETRRRIIGQKTPLPVLPEGRTDYPLDLLIGPGAQIVTVWLTTPKGVVDWFTTMLEIPGWPEFDRLKASKTFLLENDALELSCYVRPILSKQRSCTIYARGVDSYGRVVAEASLPLAADGGAATLELYFADLRSPLITVEVFAVEGAPHDFSALLLDTAYREVLYFPVRLPLDAPRPMMMASGDGIGEYNAAQYLRLLKRQGLETVYAEADAAILLKVSQYGLRFVPELQRLDAMPSKTMHVREPCLSAPDFRAHAAVVLAEGTLAHWAGGSGFYSLGSDNALCRTDENVCRSPTCLEGFRVNLEERYGSLERLAAVWGVDFSSWNEVVPANAAAVREAGNYPPWLDFRRYMDRAFASYLEYAAGIVRDVDPEGRVGMGLVDDDSANRGYDWPLLAHTLQWLAVPPEPVMISKLASYQRPGAQSGLILREGDTVEAAAAAALPWLAVLNHLPTLWMDSPYGSAVQPAPNAALQPVGNLREPYERLFRAFQTVRNGPGLLLLAAEPVPSGVAIYDSRESRYLNMLVADPPDVSQIAESSLLAHVHGLGYQPRFVAAGGLKQLDPRRFPLLFLPHVSAMSDEEIAAIQRYTEAGGTVIADVSPATHDEHGAPRTAPALATLFEETTPHSPQEAEDGGAVLEPPKPPSNVLLSRSFARLSQETLRPLCDTTGLRPAVPMRKGSDFHGQRFRFAYGNAELWALLADSTASDDQTFRLDFPEGMYVADLLSGLPLPFPHRARIKLAAGEAACFAILPYQVSEFVLVAPKSAARGKRLEFRLVLKTKRHAMGTHRVRVTFGPAFEEELLEVYTQEIVCEKGRGTGYLPLALNENPGYYRLHAWDMLSGAHAEAEVEVLPN